MVNLAGHFRARMDLPKKKSHLESGLNQRDQATAGFGRDRSHGKPSKTFYWRGFLWARANSRSVRDSSCGKIRGKAAGGVASCGATGPGCLWCSCLFTNGGRERLRTSECAHVREVSPVPSPERLGLLFLINYCLARWAVLTSTTHASLVVNETS